MHGKRYEKLCGGHLRTWNGAAASVSVICDHPSRTGTSSSNTVDRTEEWKMSKGGGEGEGALRQHPGRGLLH